MNNATQATQHNNQQAVASTGISATIRSLAPKVLISEKDLARVKPYLDLLKSTIDAPGITNIALTGNYGSGKSTIINTFLSKNDTYQPLRISLASFGNVSSEVEKTKVLQQDPVIVVSGSKKLFPLPIKSAADRKATKEKKEELERLLEVSILQQIFYHVKPSTIPDSRFKRITNIKDGEIFTIAASFAFWVISAIILFKFDFISRINPSSWHTDLNFDWWALPVFGIFFTGVGIFAKSIVRLLNNSKINKVNIKGELELGDKLDKSVFNEHLEEILYFFERTGFNLVVIEDLDRFDSTDIFTKLRELNTLLNNSLSIKERKNHKEIVFLYAISDETFKDKNERVKFFEYIIPVIPFINPTNAGDQLAQLILDANIDDQRFKEFTEDLVTFIDDIDMRLLTNIFHEYELYRDNLSSEIEQDKLFAIITYKNMFPEDFSKLHSRKGNLYNFLSRRSEYVNKLIKDINTKIEENQKEIELLQSVKVSDVEDLRGLYIKAFLKKNPGAVNIRLGGTMVNFSELIKDETFLTFSKLQKFEFYTLSFNSGYGMYNANSSYTATGFSDLENIVNPGHTYAQRSQQISSVAEGRVSELKQDNDKLRHRKQEIDSWSLSEIFEEVEIDPYIKHFSDNGLIRNLLLNGYIDENYSDFISLFHEVNMTAEDFTFEKRVKSGTASALDYKLTSTAYLAKHLNKKYFKREVILNLDLVECLLGEEYSSSEKTQQLFSLLASEKERSVNFIDQFISKKKDKAGKFITHLLTSWPGCWSYLEKKSGYAPKKIDEYLRLIIVNGNLDDLVNQGNSLSVYISNKADFLSLFATEEEKTSAGRAMEKLRVSFSALDEPDEKTGKLFDLVYEKNLYQINAENILLMLAQKAELARDEIKQANYSTIREFASAPLKSYVEDSIDTYVSEVFLKIPENKAEQEIHVLSLLNNEDVEQEHKIEIIKGGYVSITDLSQLEDFELLSWVLGENSMVESWANVFTYYDAAKAELEEEDESTKFDEILLDHLNVQENYLTLSAQPMSSDCSKGAEYLNNFAIEVMMNDGLDEEAYIALMGCHELIYDQEDLQELEAGKVEWAVKSSRVELNKYMFDHLKEHFPGQHIRLIENQQELLEKKIDELELQTEDNILLLGSNDLSKENKLLVYSEIPDETVIASATLCRLSCKLLLATPENEVSFELMQAIFTYSPSIEDRIRLLNIHFEKLSTGQVIALIGFLGGDYPELFMRRYKPTFARNDYHAELFTKLKGSGQIKDFEPYSKDDRFWRAYANY